MSGVFKSLGKIFKKVLKVAKVVIPIALAAAAVVFTGGAALGVLPTFASAMGGLVGSLGVGSALAPILTGALTNAGFGAAIGLVTGGTKGATKGAIIGGLLGGVGGAIAGAGASSVAAPALHEAGHAASLVTGATPIAPSLVTGGTAAVTSGVPAVTSAAPASATAAGGGSLVTGLLSNPLLAGQALQGLGAGLSASGQSKAEREAREREIARISGNYGVGDGLLSIINRGQPTAQEIAETATYDPMAQAGQWVYDARLGRLVRRDASAAG